MNTPQEAALHYHELGANVTAIETGAKGPAHAWKRWTETRQKKVDVQQLPWKGYTVRRETKRHKPGDEVTVSGVGIINGVNGWRTFDIDAKKGPDKKPLKKVGDDTINQLLFALGLPLDYSWVWRSGSGAGWEVAIICDEQMPAGALTPDKTETGVFTLWPEDQSIVDWHHIELRWESCQTVAPPSGDGRGYQWRGDAPTGEPAIVPLRRVLYACYDLAPPAPHNLGTVERQVVDQIKERFDLVAYAQQELGGEVEKDGGELRVLGHTGLLIDPEKGVWYIFGESIGGDAIDLVAYCEYRTTARNLNGKSAEILAQAAAFAGVVIPPRNAPEAASKVIEGEIIPAKEAPLAKPVQSPTPLQPWTGDQLLAADLPPPRVFVPHLIRAGLSFFIGQPGVGKTPALVQLAIAYATGGVWLGAFRVPQLRVAYIGPEYDRADIRNIVIASIGKDTALPDLLIFTVENFSPPDSEEEALNLIDDLYFNFGVRAVVIDLFTGFLPPEKFKPNAYRGDYREFLAYHRKALERQMPITGAWHGTKRDTNPSTMYNGGQGFWGAAGGGRLVMYRDEEDQVKLYGQMRGNKAITYTMTEAHANGKHFWAVIEGDEQEPAFNSDVHRAIWKALRQHAGDSNPLLPSVIFSILKSDYPEISTGMNYLRRALGILAKRNVIRQVGSGYALPKENNNRDHGDHGVNDVQSDNDDRDDRDVQDDDDGDTF